MKIIVDMDNTLNDFLETFIRRVPKGRRTDVCKTKDVWDLNAYITGTSEEKEAYFISEYSDPEFWLSMKPRRDSLKVMQWFKKKGCRLVIATGLPGCGDETTFAIVRAAKKEWLRRYYPDIFEEVVFTMKKWELEGDVIIDDTPHVICSDGSDRFQGVWLMPATFYNLDSAGDADEFFTNWKEVLQWDWLFRMSSHDINRVAGILRQKRTSPAVMQVFDLYHAPTSREKIIYLRRAMGKVENRSVFNTDEEALIDEVARFVGGSWRKE